MQKNKKVTFVLLPNPQLITPTMHINLGLLYVASAVKSRGHQVKIVDLRSKRSVDHLDCKQILSADFVCFSATSGEIKYAKELNYYLHIIEKDLITVVGGAHASLCPDDCNGFDAVVVGEGEKVILDIIEKGVRGRIEQERFIKDIDRFSIDWGLLPEEQMFSYTLLPGEKYGESGDKGVTLIGSRGCPFSCAFCANFASAPVVFRSPQNIYEEVYLLRDKYGVLEFRFVDDMFTLNKQWIKVVCEHLAILDIKYRCHTRADHLTREIVHWLKNSGCVEVAMGVESGDPQVLKMVNKQETVETFTTAISLLKDVGLRAKVYLISGLPGETERSLGCTYEFMCKARPDKWTLSQFTPYPGCAVWKNPMKYGVRIINKEFENYWNFTDKVTYELVGMFTSEELRARYEMLYSLLRFERWWV